MQAMTFTCLVRELDQLRERIEMGETIDAYDMAKALDVLACDVIEMGRDHAATEQDLRDEARDAYMYQEIYQEQLDHAEQHIAWLEQEFADDIVECDRYERSC